MVCVLSIRIICSTTRRDTPRTRIRKDNQYLFIRQKPYLVLFTGFCRLPYSCKYCEEHFMTRAEQLAHSNTVHAGEGDFVCHLCGKKMKTILSLENHVKLHSGLKEFKCEACGSAFATNHSLKCHKKIHERGPDNSLQYVCHVCQKPMSNKSSLNQHLKTHQSTKPHQCQHCSAS